MPGTSKRGRRSLQAELSFAGCEPPGYDRGMSVPVPVEELADAAGRFGPVVFLLTTSDDHRPHATHASVVISGAEVNCGVGRRTARNGLERPLVSLLWPPAKDGGYSLIADGAITIVGTPGEDAVATIVVSNAVLHRPATGSATPGAGCEADCVDVEVPK